MVVHPPSRSHGLGAARLLRRRADQAGFTLIELIVVVIIIAALAVLALPAISAQMRSRRTQHAAKEITSLYRSARMRAMGRGAAVMVRYDGSVDPEGRYEVREAIRGPIQNQQVNCERLPISSCMQPQWQPAGTDNQLIGEFTGAGKADFEGLRSELLDGNSLPQAQLDLCFSPMGRAFARYDQISQFTPLAAVPRIRVYRVDSSNVAVGLARVVLLLPSGAARMGMAEVL